MSIVPVSEQNTGRQRQIHSYAPPGTCLVFFTLSSNDTAFTFILSFLTASAQKETIKDMVLAV